jgi:hypothetical protein
LKNEVKKKMMIDSRKSRHQSHDERTFIAKVNQKVIETVTSRLEIRDAHRFCLTRSLQSQRGGLSSAEFLRICGAPLYRSFFPAPLIYND